MSRKRHDPASRRLGRGIEKLLGELELEIMRVVWERHPVTVREVLEALTARRPRAYTTVMTVMGRLVAKGLLAAEKQGKSYHYRPVATPAEFESHAAGQVVQSLLADFGSDLAVSQFVEGLTAVDPEQLARLAAMARLAEEEHHEA